MHELDANTHADPRNVLALGEWARCAYNAESQDGKHRVLH